MSIKDLNGNLLSVSGIPASATAATYLSELPKATPGIIATSQGTITIPYRNEVIIHPATSYNFTVMIDGLEVGPFYPESDTDPTHTAKLRVLESDNTFLELYGTGVVGGDSTLSLTCLTSNISTRYVLDDPLSEALIASYINVPVQNDSPIVKPVPTSIDLLDDGVTIEVTYSELMDAVETQVGAQPLVNNYHLIVGGNEYDPVDAVVEDRVDHSVVVLTSPYSIPTNVTALLSFFNAPGGTWVVRESDQVDANPYTNQAIDITASLIPDATAADSGTVSVDGKTASINYGTELIAGALPVSEFQLYSVADVGGDPVITQYAINTAVIEDYGSSVILAVDLATPISYGVEMYYTHIGTSVVRSADNTPVLNTDDLPLVNNSEVGQLLPTSVNVSSNGQSVLYYYSEQIEGTPLTTDFEIISNGVNRTVISASIVQIGVVWAINVGLEPTEDPIYSTSTVWASYSGTGVTTTSTGYPLLTFALEDPNVPIVNGSTVSSGTTNAIEDIPADKYTGTVINLSNSLAPTGSGTDWDGSTTAFEIDANGMKPVDGTPGRFQLILIDQPATPLVPLTSNRRAEMKVLFTGTTERQSIYLVARASGSQDLWRMEVVKLSGSTDTLEMILERVVRNGNSDGTARATRARDDNHPQIATATGLDLTQPVTVRIDDDGFTQLGYVAEGYDPDPDKTFNRDDFLSHTTSQDIEFRWDWNQPGLNNPNKPYQFDPNYNTGVTQYGIRSGNNTAAGAVYVQSFTVSSNVEMPKRPLRLKGWWLEGSDYMANSSGSYPNRTTPDTIFNLDRLNDRGRWVEWLIGNDIDGWTYNANGALLRVFWRDVEQEKDAYRWDLVNPDVNWFTNHYATTGEFYGFKFGLCWKNWNNGRACPAYMANLGDNVDAPTNPTGYEDFDGGNVYSVMTWNGVDDPDGPCERAIEWIKAFSNQYKDNPHVQGFISNEMSTGGFNFFSTTGDRRFWEKFCAGIYPTLKANGHSYTVFGNFRRGTVPDTGNDLLYGSNNNLYGTQDNQEQCLLNFLSGENAFGPRQTGSWEFLPDNPDGSPGTVLPDMRDVFAWGGPDILTLYYKARGIFNNSYLGYSDAFMKGGMDIGLSFQKDSYQDETEAGVVTPAGPATYDELMRVVQRGIQDRTADEGWNNQPNPDNFLQSINNQPLERPFSNSYMYLKMLLHPGSYDMKFYSAELPSYNAQDGFLTPYQRLYIPDTDQVQGLVAFNLFAARMGNQGYSVCKGLDGDIVIKRDNWDAAAVIQADVVAIQSDATPASFLNSQLGEVWSQPARQALIAAILTSLDLPLP